MIKILFLIFSYSMGGGAEALLTSIVNNLNPQKYDISIREIYHYDVKTEPTNSNVHVLEPMKAVPTPENRSQKWQIYNSPEVLINAYVKGDYDLYISFNYQKPTFLLPKGTKNIAWIHSDVYDLADPEVKREKDRQEVAFQNVAKIVSICDITTQSLIDLFPSHADKIVQIWNGVDIDQIKHKGSDTTEIKLEEYSIIFVGRLEERKDPVRLIHILNIIHQTLPDVHLYYLGKGELDQEIYSTAKQLDLENNVHLLGYHQNPFPIIAQAKVNVFLSKTEGFGLGIAEGLCLGIPFVGTDVGALRELSNNGKCGKIVQSDHEAASEITRLLSIDKENISIECKKSVERFGMANYISKIEDLIDSVMESQNQEENNGQQFKTI